MNELMSRRFWVIMGIVLLFGCRVSAAEPAASWKAGMARVCITPEHLMWMSGYGARTKPAEGKLTDLWAKALVLEDPAGRRAVLVTMDLVGIPRDLSVDVCQQIKMRFDLPREAIMLAASHTHTGPVVRHNLETMFDLDATQRGYIAEYTKALRGHLIDIVADALKKLEPVELTWGIGRATFAVNRRNNKEADVPRLIDERNLKGPVDHDVPVLAVRDRGGKLKAIVCGYACHATVLSFYQWSGDYPGFAQMDLEKDHPGATAFFWAGCGGDQNPLPRRAVALAQKYGRQLADSVNDVLKTNMKLIHGMLNEAYTEIDLPFGDLPTREQIVKDSMSNNRPIANRAKWLLQQIADKGSLRGTYPYPVQALQLGSDLTWVALGGEVVVDYSLGLKKDLGATTWVAGYTNDVMAYIPSLRVLKEGGYEGGGAMVYYGLPAAWGPRVEELIVAAVHEQVKKVRGAVK